ncbi:hypothetical protein D3C86_1984640 [compost metagenome]
MSTSEYVIRVAAHCLPNARDAAERQIQSDIKRALEKQTALEAAKAEQEAREQAEQAERAAREMEALEASQSGRESSEVRPDSQVAATHEGEKGEK